MTREEIADRNDDLCKYYVEGHTLDECAERFGFSSQWARKILQRKKIWRPQYIKNRTKFLGVNISEETKAALARQAEERGVSVSRLVSDHVDKLVK